MLQARSRVLRFHRPRWRRAAVRLPMAAVVGMLTCGVARAGIDVWTNTGPGGGRVLCVAADPTNPTTVYAGTASGGLFKSTDGGATWSGANTGLPLGGETLGLTTVWSIAVDPKAPSIVYAGTSAGVFKSTDGAASWQAANTGLINPSESAPSIVALAVDPQVSATLYAAAAVWGGSVFKSINGGASWSSADTGILDAWGSPAVTALAIDPLAPATLYAAAQSTAFKTTSAAGTWLPLAAPAPNTDIHRLDIDPSTPATVYLGTRYGTPAGVLKTTDSGNTWSPVNNGLPGPPTVGALAVDPLAPTTVYVATSSCEASSCISGVYRSPNGGQAWAATAMAGSSDYSGAYFVDALAVAPTSPPTIFAADWIDGLSRSADSGATWTDANSGMANTLIVSLAPDPGTPATLYAATYEGGIFKSTDRGVTWAARRNGLPRWYGLAPVLAVARTDANLLYAGTQQGLYRTADGGESWQPVNSGLPSNPWITAVAVDPSNTGIAYAAAVTCADGPCAGGLYKTTDGGATWAPTALGGNDVIVEGIAIDGTAPSTLYASARDANMDGSYLFNGVYRSVDGGANWELRSPALVQLGRVLIDPTTPSTLYVTGNTAGEPMRVFKSSDSGATWNPIDAGLPEDLYAPPDLAIDPADAGKLYAATDSGVFRSTDAGVNWTPFDNGLTQVQFATIAVDPFVSAVVYAASAGGGVFVIEQGSAGYGIAGRVRYYNGLHGVGGAAVELHGTPPASQLTNGTGEYAFGGLAAATWTVAPRKDGDFGGGIGALDAVFVLQSVAGTRTLDANQRLAADVTGNGSISALDAARILQKAVGMIDRLPVATTCNSDWLFVPAPAAAANRHAIPPAIGGGGCQPGAIAYTPLAGPANGQDFAGILIGDVTGNWIPSAGAAAAAMAEAPAAGVRLGRARAVRGARVRIPVYVSSAAATSALDFRVQFDPARLRLARVRRGPQARGALLAHHHGDTPGVVRIAMASATALPPNGSILVLEFDGNAAAPVRVSGRVGER
ncbi:dockerin type I domain-containing protein [Candidatus Binatia bacterium]|nr:dockerin type I domain-containing protein [Candidatus Binatia bacterium]